MTYLFKKYEYILIVDKGLLKGFTLQKNRPLGTTDLYCITLIQEEKKSMFTLFLTLCLKGYKQR